MRNVAWLLVSILALGVSVLLTTPTAPTASPAARAAQVAPDGPAVPAKPVAGTSCTAFPADSYWHADVRDLPRHPRSKQWLRRMSADRDLHPDFGPSYGKGPDYGIPITVVRHSHKRVKVKFGYADESDRVRYPLGRDTRIEGGRNSGGDMHAIVVDKGTCKLFETFDTRVRDGRWTAGSGAVWSLKSHDLRPDGWTSADAAGLPILPGLLRWNEVRDRVVDHAIRFTTDVTSRWYLWPARHQAGARDSHKFPPMGARFRLKSSWKPTGLGSDAREVVRAMKTYGLVLADNGSPWFFQGEQHKNWPSSLVEDLKQIPASAFVAVDTSGLMVDEDSAEAK